MYVTLFSQVREYSFGTSLPVLTSASIVRIHCCEEDENEPVVCYLISSLTPPPNLYYRRHGLLSAIAIRRILVIKRMLLSGFCTWIISAI